MKTWKGLGAARTTATLAFALSVALVFGLLLFVVWSDAHCRQTKDCGGYQPATQKTPNGKHEETLWERTTHDPIALYTFWLAIFTAGLTVASIWQGYFLVSADKNARIAANAARDTAKAAEKTADAALGVELPRLEMCDVSWDGGPASTLEMIKQGTIKIHLRNYGRTTVSAQPG